MYGQAGVQVIYRKVSGGAFAEFRLRQGFPVVAGQAADSRIDPECGRICQGEMKAQTVIFISTLEIAVRKTGKFLLRGIFLDKIQGKQKGEGQSG